MNAPARLLALCALVLFSSPLFAEEAVLTITITNQNEPLRTAWFGVYKPGVRNSYLKYVRSGNPLKIEAGTYDIGLHFDEDTVKVVKWLENQTLQGQRQETIDLATPLSRICYTITNGNQPPGRKAWWGLYPSKDAHYLRYKHSGECLLAVSGVYTVGVHYEDDAIDEHRWFENEKFEGARNDKTVDLAMPVAEVKYTVTNNGEDVKRKAWWGLYTPGRHGAYLRYKYSGESMSVKSGVYDIGIQYEDGNLKKEIWLENEKLEGVFDKKVELNAATTHAKVIVTNGGVEVGRKAWWAVYKPGQHKAYLAYKYSGESMTIDSGTYDIGIFFHDGDAREERWLENQILDKQYEKNLELAVPLSDVKVVVTNNGIDTGRKSWWGIYEKGERNHYLAYKYSGNNMVLQEGVYDLGVHFRDGAVELTRWVPDFEVKGKVEKTVELSAGIANLSVRVTRNGQLLEKAWCGAYKSRQSPSYEAYAYSDKPMRVLKGTYDVGCFSPGHGEKWLEKQEITGDTQLAVELDEAPASLIVRGVGANARTGQVKTGDSSAREINISIIFDASGSMAAKVEEDKNRIEVAKEVLSELIDTLPANARVELQAYGLSPKAQKDCRDTRVLSALGPIQPEALKDSISQLKPGGYTPIAYSLEKAAASLPQAGNNSLILITDGIESCNGDPCAAAARLSAQGLVTRSFVVGFGLGLDKGRFLSCIGKYYPASDRAGLKAALKEVISESLQPVSGHVSVYRPGDRKTVIVQGSMEEKLMLPAGIYDITVRTGGRDFTMPAKKIQGNVELPLTEASN